MNTTDTVTSRTLGPGGVQIAASANWRVLAYIATLLLAISLGTPVQAQTKKPDFRPYTPSGWSRPMVLKLDDSGNLIVDYAVANTGTADASTSFSTRLYLDNTTVLTYTKTSLKAGYYFTRSGANLGKLTTGEHRLEVRVDYNSKVSELLETNNSLTLRFVIEDDDVLTWPLPSQYTSVSQRFGDNWSANTAKRHTGMDLPAKAGTSVYAAKEGKVTKKGSLGGDWGDYVIVGHENDTWTTCYLHVNSTLQVGSRVTEGQKIGTVFKDHLHFGIRIAPTGVISPRGALPKTGPSEDPLFPEKFVDPEDYQFEGD